MADTRVAGWEKISGKRGGISPQLNANRAEKLIKNHG
jgi:hypothetical protein